MIFVMKTLVFFALITVSFTLMAEERPLSACQLEIKEHCPNETVRPNTINCLLKLEKEVTPQCKQELQRLGKVVEATGARGGGGLSSFGGVMGGIGLLPPKKTIVSLNGQLAPEGNPTVIEQSKINIATPIWSDGGESFSMSVNAGRLSFNEQQSFDTGIKTPKELNRIELGAQYSKAMKSKRMFGLRTSIGSASDKPFHSSDEITFSLNSFYTNPGSTENTHWIWTVFLSNNNPLINYVPIPGFIYLYKTEKFTGMFGLPFLSIQWTPIEPWIFSMSYFITNFNSEIAYGFRDKVQTFTGFSISQQSFLRADRDELRDRLFFNEKKIFAGIRSPLTKSISGEIQSGMAFDRKLKEGESFNDTEMESDFGRSWYLGMSLNILI